MHFIMALALAAGLVSAAPQPQKSLDIAAMLAEYEAAKTTMTTAVAAAMTGTPSAIVYDQKSAMASAAEEAPTITASTTTPVVGKGRRDGSVCSPLATGNGPVPSEDTPDAFLADPTISSIALSAPTSATGGFTQSSVNLQGSTQQLGYLTFYILDTYDVEFCAAQCNSITQCLGYNIYFERDPTVDPNDASCANPPSTTFIKCNMYGYPVYAETATNHGQWRNQFGLVIAGSNGYSKSPLPPSPPGFTNATAYNGAISAGPGDVKYIASEFYTSPFDVSVCAAACQAVTKNDRENHPDGAATYDACNFFNAWIAVDNNVPIGWTCSMYAGPPNRPDMDSNYGQASLKIVESVGYSAIYQDPGVF